MKTGEQFKITEIRKVETGRLYVNMGVKFEKYFTDHRRADADDTINWDHEVKISTEEEKGRRSTKGS